MGDLHRADRQLATELAAGNREAWAEFVRRHHGDVYRLLARLCRNAHDAEDLTQETFVACWSGIGRFRGLSVLGPWIRRIAYHKFVGWLRRLPADRTSGDADRLAEAAVASDPLPSSKLQVDEEVRRVVGALNRIDAASREVVVLHYQHGMSFQEMSELLGQPLGTVKWRVSLALDRLRDRLNREEGAEHERRSRMV